MQKNQYKSSFSLKLICLRERKKERKSSIRNTIHTCYRIEDVKLLMIIPQTTTTTCLYQLLVLFLYEQSCFK